MASRTERPADRLRATLARFGLPPEDAPRFEALLSALFAEPDPHTTVDIAEAVDVHVADSLSALEVAQLRSAARIADVGAGVGFPGLPLAIALPQTQVDLIESAGRKAAVIERLAGVAGARNARVLAVRAEELAGEGGREAYDAVTARAVAPMAVLVEYAAPLLAIDGVLVAWKGERDREEEKAAAAAVEHLGMTPRAVIPVQPYPGSRNRHLHVYAKTEPTPDRFPRRPGMAAKRPLV